MNAAPSLSGIDRPTTGSTQAPRPLLAHRFPIALDGARFRFHADAKGWRATSSRPNQAGSVSIECRRGAPETLAEGASAFAADIHARIEQRFARDGKSVAVAWYRWRHGTCGIRAGSPPLRIRFQCALDELVGWSLAAAAAYLALVDEIHAAVGCRIVESDSDWIRCAEQAIAEYGDRSPERWKQRFLDMLEKN